MINGVSAMAKTRIKAPQLFHGGAEADQALLWILHELNNTDKHRLIPMVTVRCHVGEGWIKRDGASSAAFLRDEADGRRLENRAEIARVPLGDERNVKMFVPVGADVAFQAIGGCKDIRAPSLLRELSTYIRELILSFRGEFPKS